MLTAGALLLGSALAQAQTADLVLQLTDSPDPVVAGAVVAYTATLTNNGPNAATGVTLVNTIPTGTSLVSIVTPTGVTCALTTAPRTYTCSGFANITTADTLEVVFNVRPDDASAISASGNLITNTATATTSATDPNPANNTNRTEQTTVNAGADLAASKSVVGAGPFVAGAVLQYTINGSNAGPFPANGTIRIRDTLPVGSVYAGLASFSQNGWSCTHNGATPGVVTCDRAGPLAPGDSTPSFTVSLRPQIDGNITSGASIVSTLTSDPQSLNDNANVTTAIVPGADLGITKSGTPNPVAQGSTITWTLNPVNGGPSASGTITVADTLPAGLLFVEGSVNATGWTCAFSAPTLTCTRPGLSAPGALPAITYQTVAVSAGVQSNSATISGTTADPDPSGASNTATQSVTVQAAGVDLSIAKTGPSSVVVNVPFNFTLRARNLGPSTTDGVVRVVDTLPANLSFVSVSAAAPWNCTFLAPTLTCDHPAGVVGSPATTLADITLRVTATDTAAISNTATISKVGGTLADPNSLNDSSTYLLGGGAAAQNNNMSTSKVVLIPAPPTTVVAPGTTVRYRITPRANGNVAIPVGATVTLTDTLPASLSAPTVLASDGWTCGFTAPTLICTRTLAAAVAPGSDFPVIEYTAMVQALGTGTDAIVNNACTSVSGGGIAATTGCASATLNRTLNRADLRIQKSDSGSTQWGSILTYTLRVDNLGPDAATNVTVTDDLLNATFIDATAPCSFNAGTGRLTCAIGTIGTLASGTPQTVITVRVRPRDNGPFPASRPNTASVISSDVGDPDLTNNAASVSTQITAAVDLQLGKTANPSGGVQGGRPLDYTLTLRNSTAAVGGVASGQVRVVDTLPAGVTYDSIQSVSGGGACVPNGPPVTEVVCTWASIAANEQQTAVIRVFPVNNGNSSLNLDNNAVAEVITGATDPDTSNNSATVSNTVTPASADLVVNKTVSPDPVAEGSENTYTVTVTNNGPSRATAVTLTDTLPNATVLSFVPGSITTTVGTCTFNAGPTPLTNTLTCSFGDMANGATATVTYRLRAMSLGNVANTATASSPTPDPTPGNNTVVRDATSRVGADLALVKTGTSRVAVGGTATYTLQVSNNGPGAARFVTVTDTLPAGLSFVSGAFSGATGNGGCTATGQVVTCAIPSAASSELPVGNNVATVTITSIARDTAPQTVTNTATVASAFNPDIVPGNNTATAQTVVVRPLTGVKVFNPNPAPAGGVSQVAVTISNVNSFAVTGAAFTDSLPSAPGQMVVATTPAATTTCAGGSVTALPGATSFALSGATVPANGSCAVTVNVTPPVVGTYANTIPAGGLTSTGEPLAISQAPFSANLSALTPTTLTIAKTTSAAQFTVGQTATYTVTVGNSGGFPTTGAISVTDALPTGLTFVSATGAGWACGAAGQMVTCTSSTVIPAGASGNPITLDVNVGPAAVATVTNTAQASGGGAVNTPSSTVVTPVRPAADLAVAKSSSNPNPTPGVTFNYVLTATNAGPSTATDVAVHDPLPAGITFNSVVSATQGTFNAGTGRWSVGALPAGGSANLVISVTRAGVPPSITNVATISAPEFDPNTGNNTAQVTVPQGVANLSLTKSVSNASPPVGTNVTFTVTLRNNGPEAATGVRVADSLPLGYAFVSASTSQGTFNAATGQWTVGSVANGAIATLAIVATVRPTGPYLNMAQVSASDQSDPDSTPNNHSPSRPLENDEATAVVVPTPVADLRAVKSGPATVAPGGALNYSVVVTNLGPSAADGALFTDLVPPGVVVTSALCGSAAGGAVCGTVAAANQTVSSTIATLPAGGAVTFTITGIAPLSGTLLNRAQVVTAAGVDDPDDPGRSGAGNNGSSVITQVQTVSVVKTVVDDNGAPLLPGEAVTWTIAIANPAGEVLTNAHLADAIPANTTYVPGSTTLNGAPVADVGGASLLAAGGLAVNTPGQPAGTLTVGGAAAIVTFRTRVNAGVVPGSTIANQAQFTATGQVSGQPIAQLSDDPTTPAGPDATRIPTGGAPVLESEKTVVDDNGGTLLVGETVTYTVVVSNRGNVAATGVRIRDPIPTNAAYLSGTLRYKPAGGSEGPLTDGADADAGDFGASASNAVSVQVGTLAPGQSVTLRFRATVTNGVVVSNQAVISANELPQVLSDGDGDHANGNQPTDIVVGNSALLRQTKSVLDVNGGALAPGDVLEYLIITRNAGVAAASNVIVTDAVPPSHTAYVAGSTLRDGVPVPDVGGASALVAGFNVGTLLPGQTQTIRFRVTVAPTASAGTIIDNQAFFVADGAGAGDGPLRGRSDSDLDDGVEAGNDAANPNDDDPTRVVVGGAPGSASVSGVVYLDLNSNRVLDGADPLQEGWSVELVRGGKVVASATTDAAGSYVFRGVAPGGGYQIRFRNPLTGVVYGRAQSAEPGVNLSDGTIRNLALVTGSNVVDQNLPLDPSGVIYNAITRQPVGGVQVFIDGPSGFDPVLHLLPGQQGQVTASSGGTAGLYRFDLNFAGGAPFGIYTLRFAMPPGYLTSLPGSPSTLLPPAASTAGCAAAHCLLVPNVPPDPFKVQANPGPPTGAQPTTYFVRFEFTGLANANVIQNHIPIDPITSGAIVLVKTAPRLNVSRGDLVPYRITATNTLPGTVPNINLVDTIPPGFRYRSGTARIDGVPVEPQVNGRVLTWPNQSFSAGERKVVTMVLTVGAGVQEGEYVNSVVAINSLVNAAASNVATAAVRIVPDPTLDCSDLIGKVFDDRNANGVQDAGEPGIPDVRLATLRGLLVSTDQEGRYHIVCADVPNEARGSNFVLKVDERTLPTGFRMTTENPGVVRLTRGRLGQLDFGAAILRVVRLEVAATAFLPGEVMLRQEWTRELAPLMDRLRQQPSVLRVAYALASDPAEDKDLARRRLSALALELRRLWQAQQCCYALSIEEELMGGKR